MVSGWAHFRLGPVRLARLEGFGRERGVEAQYARLRHQREERRAVRQHWICNNAPREGKLTMRVKEEG